MVTALVQANIVSFLDYEKRFLTGLPDTNFDFEMWAAKMPEWSFENV